MATICGPIQHVYETNGKAPIRFYPEGTARTFTAGMLVDVAAGVTIGAILDTGASGEPGTGTGNIDFSTGTVKVMGIALKAATGTASTTGTIPIQVLTPGSVIRIACYHASSKAASVTAITDVGNYGEILLLDRGASYTPRYVHVLDKATLVTAATADTQCQVIGVDPIGTVGTGYDYYLAVLTPTACRLAS